MRFMDRFLTGAGSGYGRLDGTERTDSKSTSIAARLRNALRLGEGSGGSFYGIKTHGR